MMKKIILSMFAVVMLGPMMAWVIPAANVGPPDRVGVNSNVSIEALMFHPALQAPVLDPSQFAPFDVGDFLSPDNPNAASTAPPGDYSATLQNCALDHAGGTLVYRDNYYIFNDNVSWIAYHDGHGGMLDLSPVSYFSG